MTEAGPVITGRYSNEKETDFTISNTLADTVTVANEVSTGTAGVRSLIRAEPLMSVETSL